MADEDDIKQSSEEEQNAQPTEGGASETSDSGMPLMTDMMSGFDQNESKKFDYKIIIFIVVVLVLIVLYFPVYKFGVKEGYKQIFQPDISSMRQETEFSKPVYPILDLNVNLRDLDLLKYLKISMHLIVREDNELSECSLREAQIRDVLIMLLTRFRSKDIDSISQQRKLKRLIKDEINVILTRSRVTDIYFTKFRILLLQPKNYITFNKE